MSENVRFSIASENVRFSIAVVIALALIATYHLTSPDSAAQPLSQMSTSAAPE